MAKIEYHDEGPDLNAGRLWRRIPEATRRKAMNEARLKIGEILSDFPRSVREQILAECVATQSWESFPKVDHQKYVQGVSMQILGAILEGVGSPETLDGQTKPDLLLEADGETT